MANLLDTSAQFVAGNAMDIILVVLLLFLLTVYIITNNITFPKSHPRLKEIVIMETFTTDPPAVGVSALCGSTIGNSSLRNEGCRALSESQCELAHCCVWAKPKGAKADKLKTETDPEKLLQNPAWHIHEGKAPERDIPLSFGILLNLVSVCNTSDPELLWAFISRYAKGATPENAPYLDKLVGYAINYYNDFVKPTKKYRAATDAEKAALTELRDMLKTLDADTDGGDIQTQVFEVGKNHNYENLRDWFKALYEILLGQEQGPRMGSFIALYGIDESIQLIDRAIAGEELGA